MSSRPTGISFVRPALYALTGVAVLAAPRLPVLADLEWGIWAAIAGAVLLLILGYAALYVALTWLANTL